MRFAFSVPILPDVLSLIAVLECRVVEVMCVTIDQDACRAIEVGEVRAFQGRGKMQADEGGSAGKKENSNGSLHARCGRTRLDYFCSKHRAEVYRMRVGIASQLRED